MAAGDEAECSSTACRRRQRATRDSCHRSADDGHVDEVLLGEAVRNMLLYFRQKLYQLDYYPVL